MGGAGVGGAGTITTANMILHTAASPSFLVPILLLGVIWVCLRYIWREDTALHRTVLHSMVSRQGSRAGTDIGFSLVHQKQSKKNK